jgi:hypothetical protein
MYLRHFGDELISASVDSSGYDIGRSDLYKNMLFKDPRGDIEGGNLLSQQWDVFPVKGVMVQVNEDELNLDFGNNARGDYFHAVKSTLVEPDTGYKLSGFIRADHLLDSSGVALEIQDARGWVKTLDLSRTQPLKSADGWNVVEAFYKTLPDARALKVLCRRYSKPDAFSGKVFIKGVRLVKFKPLIESRIPYVTVNASKSADGKKIFLMILNKNLSSPVTAKIVLNGFMPSGNGRVFVLNGSAVNVTNERMHDAVSVTESELEGASSDFDMTFEPHSLTTVELESR